MSLFEPVCSILRLTTRMYDDEGENTSVWWRGWEHVCMMTRVRTRLYDDEGENTSVQFIPNSYVK